MALEARSPAAAAVAAAQLTTVRPLDLMPTKMTVILASPPDRERLVAMISCDQEQWAEVHQEAGSLTLELYPRQSGDPWEFSLDDAVAALQHARERLTGRCPGLSPQDGAGR